MHERATLAEADALRSGSHEDASRARAVYWARRGELDPRREHDVPRILHVLRSGLPRDDAFAALASQATHATDDRLRKAAEICVGQCFSVAGQHEEAEARLRAVLKVVRGTGTRLERTAYSSLAAAYQARGREFEALVLTRIVVRLSSTADDPWEACVAHQQYCALLASLGDWDPVDAALDQLVISLRAADVPWAWTMWRYIHGERTEAALEREDLATARKELACMEAAVPEGVDEPAVGPWQPLLAARLALAEGRPQAALTYLDPEHRQPGSLACIVAVRASLAVGDEAGALRHGRACLDALQAGRED